MLATKLIAFLALVASADAFVASPRVVAAPVRAPAAALDQCRAEAPKMIIGELQPSRLCGG